MAKKKITGLDELHRYQMIKRHGSNAGDALHKTVKVWGLEKEAHYETKEALTSEKQAHDGTKEAIKQRNRTGGDGKARKYEPQKTIIRQMHKTLKAEIHKNPPFKILIERLEKEHPALAWKEDTVRDWLKKLNKGEPI